MRLRIYVDTSVIAGCFESFYNHRSKWSWALFDSFRRGRAVLVTSDLVTAELERAYVPSGLTYMAPSEHDSEDLRIRLHKIYYGVPTGHREHFEHSDLATHFARSYMGHGKLGPCSLVDAQHIFMAMLARADVLVSWDYEHIYDNIKRIWQTDHFVPGYRWGMDLADMARNLLCGYYAARRIYDPPMILRFIRPWTWLSTMVRRDRICYHFDSMAMVRGIRDELSRELEHMNPEEERQYLRTRAALFEVRGNAALPPELRTLLKPRVR